MATFRSSAGVVMAMWCLACTPPRAHEAPVADVAAIARQGIEHVTPKRDFVGVAPVDGVDSYTVTVMNEVGALFLDYRRATGTSKDWPKEIKLETGTYFWRVVGSKDGRGVAIQAGPRLS